MKRKFLILLFSLVFAGCQEEIFHFPTKIDVGKEFRLQTDLSSGTAKKIAGKLQGALENYQEFIPFKTKRSRRFTVSIFENQEDFNAYRDRISMVKSTTGFYEPRRGELGVVYRGAEATTRTLYHEIFHAFLEDRIIHPPAWLNEGLAEYAETMPFGLLSKLTRGSGGDQWVGTLKKINREKRFPRLRDVIEKDWPNRHQLSKEEYAISWALVYFFNKSKDDTIQENFQKYLQLLYDKKHPKKAFYQVWPDIDALDAEWRAFLKKMLIKKTIFLPTINL